MENQSCLETKSYVPMVINVMVHVLILFTILSLFFMLYIAPTEKHALNGEIKNNIYKFVNSKNVNISPEYKPFLKSEEIQNIKRNYSKPSRLAEMHNKWLFRTIVLTNISLFMIVSIITALLLFQCNQCIPIGHILLENGLTFLFVGAVEYLFFTKVALNYIPSKPSGMASSFLESLNKHL